MATVPGSGQRNVLEPPDTPAQAFAALSGLFLVALGVLALIFAGVGFGTVDSLADRPEFLIWTVSGWTTILWIAIGTLGLVSMVRLDAARTYALLTAATFTILAVWGFVDGRDVAGVFVADTADNVTHAILAALALVVGMPPHQRQTDGEHAARRDRGSGPRRSPASLRAVDRQ